MKTPGLGSESEVGVLTVRELSLRGRNYGRAREKHGRHEGKARSTLLGRSSCTERGEDITQEGTASGCIATIS